MSPVTLNTEYTMSRNVSRGILGDVWVAVEGERGRYPPSRIYAPYAHRMHAAYLRPQLAPNPRTRGAQAARAVPKLHSCQWFVGGNFGAERSCPGVGVW